MLGEIFRCIRYLGRRSQFEGEWNEEVRFHLEARTEELQRDGLPCEEARAQARREFGPRARASEDSRAAWQFRWIEELVADFRYAVRSFASRPAFTLTAIGCLAIGIGANTLIFSLVNTVLLRSMPYPHADRMVMVRFSPPNQPEQKLGNNSGIYFFVRDHSRVFERIGAIRITGVRLTPGADSDTQATWAQEGWTSPGLTDVFGIQPMIGRWFVAQDTGMYLQVVISHKLWQTMYGGVPEVVGKEIYLDGNPATIVGVMASGYQTLSPDVDLWRFQSDENLASALRSPNRLFNIFGRLKPGVTMEQAQADLDALASPLGEEFAMNRGWSIRVDSLRDAYVGYLRQPLLILQGAVFLVLLIACANVAGLLLAQGAARQKELAVRATLGSSRGRIIRQLLTENLLLSIAGGAIGITLAWAGLRALVNTTFASNPDLHSAALDWTVVGFALAVSAGTGILFGVLPAIQIARPDLMQVMRESGRSLTAGSVRSRLRSAFVVSQVALALVLLAGSGLLIRSLIRLNATDPGLDPRRLVAIQIPFSRTFYHGVPGVRNTTAGGFLVEFDSRFSQLSERVRERLAQVPGVESATAAVTPPLGAAPRRLGFTRDGRTVTESDQGAWTGEWYPVSASYFDALRIPVRRGRAIGVQDTETSAPVVVINETLARRFFPGEDPVGRRLQLDLLNDSPREIVGVVGDVRQDRFQAAPQPHFYVPRTQLPQRMDMAVGLEVLVVTYVVRTAGDPASVAPALRAAILDADRSLAVSSVRTVEEYAAGQLQELSQYAALLSVFGGISVTLAIIGIFGVMAHTVNQRTHEMGIRLALGARAGNVLRLVMGHGFVLISAGLLLGLLVALLLAPVIRSFLWGITATDPVTFFVAMAGLMFLALLACYLPARRASRVDPVIALRNE